MTAPPSYRYCPMCAARLVRAADREGVARRTCLTCGWVHYPGNILGVNVVIEAEDGVVFLFPPGEPPDAPAALVGGVVEQGETPEQAAVREAKEESGLDVELVAELGRWFWPDQAYGPMVSFMFVGRAVGGHLRGSVEGTVEIHPVDDAPAIGDHRKGSRRVWDAYRGLARTT